MVPATEPSGSRNLMGELDFAFFADSSSSSSLGTDGILISLFLLLDSESSSDVEPSGSIHRGAGLTSAMSSVRSLSTVVDVIVTSFKGGGFMFGEVVAIRSETGGGVIILWGDTRLCVTRNR